MSSPGSPTSQKRTHEEMTAAASPPADRDSSTPTPPIRSTPPTGPISDEAQANGGAASRKTEDDENLEDEDEDDADPTQQIEDFEWEKLEERYHDMIQQRQTEEENIVAEFNRLMNYFSVWAQTNSVHEVERSFKRLRTRMYHVQYSEDKLEEKRQHYLRVVQAFQSALSLLNGK